MLDERFSARQIRVVCATLEGAEARVSAFYGIAPREWKVRFPYELATLAEHGGPGFERGSLAQVLRLQPASPGRRTRFRIVLRDTEILRTGRRHGLRRTLLWVLVHELIHVVRFTLEPPRFDSRGEGRHREEARVLELTRRILAPEDDPRLASLLRRMEAISAAAAGGPPPPFSRPPRAGSR